MTKNKLIGILFAIQMVILALCIGAVYIGIKLFIG